MDRRWPPPGGLQVLVALALNTPKTAGHEARIAEWLNRWSEL
jgi:hypothetical protein